MSSVSPDRIAEEVRRLREESEQAGYRLNPDEDFLAELVEGLLVNEERFGYRACPCRLASGDRAADLDIICPCDYRDPDIAEFGACYCGLFVSEEVFSGAKEIRSIPDRRPPAGERERGEASEGDSGASPEGVVLRTGAGAYPLWRCRVCGYLCAREEPPGKCPVCKADADRFERVRSSI